MEILLGLTVSIAFIGLGVYVITSAGTIAAFGNPDSRVPPSEAKTKTVSYIGFIAAAIGVIGVGITILSAGVTLLSVDDTVLYKLAQRLGDAFMTNFFESLIKGLGGS